MSTAGAPKAPTGGTGDSLGVDRALLDQAIGGWRGMIDSGLPAAVFVVAYLITSQQLQPAVDRRLEGTSAWLRVVREKNGASA